MSISTITSSGTLSQSTGSSTIVFTPTVGTPSNLDFSGGSGVSISASVTVTLSSDLSFNNVNQFFVIGGTGVTFDGSLNTITIASVTNYPGLIKCSNATYITAIQNVGVLGSTSTIETPNGWVVQGTGSDAGITATNCYSTGTIANFSGGIFGNYSHGTAITCYSIGSIGDSSGGIFGQNSTSAVATNCYSTGTNGPSAGGIFGTSATTCTATKCYSTSSVIGGGGIFANSPTTCVANYCYSIGAPQGGAGGIFSAFNNGCTANYCYSTGGNNGGGGIFGTGSTSSNANNCYSLGSNPNRSLYYATNSGCIATNCYSIGGSDTSGATQSNCILNSTGLWVDASANSTIDVGTSGLIWTDIDTTSTSVPWLLSAFNSEIYDPSFATFSSTSFNSGDGLFGYSSNYTGSPIPANYQIISVTNSPTTSIDASGNISFSDTTTGFTYIATVVVYYNKTVSSYVNQVGYNINTFTGEVSSGPLPCFLKGTKIKTSQNEYKLVQDLKEGDKVCTPDGRLVPVLKINQFTSDAGEGTSPYIIPRGYHGANEFECNEDLYLSPDHGVLKDYENIVLVKTMGFKQDNTLSRLNYYHLTLPNFFTDHVIANGVACESYGKNFYAQCNNNMDILAFNYELMKKVYCKKTFSRKHVTTQKYNVLLDHFMGGNPQMENSPKYMISMM